MMISPTGTNSSTMTMLSLATIMLTTSHLLLKSTTVTGFSTKLPSPPKPTNTNTNNSPNPNPPPPRKPPTRTILTPPTPFKFPLLGTLPDFLLRGGVDNFSQIHESMYRDFGPLYSMSILNSDEFIMCDPNLFDTVLRKEGKFPIGGAESVTTFIDYYEENNLTMAMKGTGRGEGWKEWRESLNPDMYAAWEGYLPSIAEAAGLISKVAGREVGNGHTNGNSNNNIAFVDFISRAAFDMFESVMYGSSPQTTDSTMAAEEDVEFVKASQKAFDITGALTTNPMEKVFESDLYKEFVVNMDKTFGFAREKTKRFAEEATVEQQMHSTNAVTNNADAINATNDNDEQTTTTSETPADTANAKCPIQTIKQSIPTKFPNPSFIQRLVHRGQLTNDEIAELGAPLLMAGVDTTAYVMSWLYLNLASNPHVQSKLAHELHTVLRGNDVTTVEQMESLPYLKACIRESHRLTPPTPVMIKILQQDVDIVLPNTNEREDKEEAYRIKAGQRISLNLRAFPMDPTYVTDPNEYRPERFLQDAIDQRKGTPSEIIDHPSFADPFGRGKRRCLGVNVAQAEILILAARLIQDWEILLVDPGEKGRWRAKQKLMLKADPYPAMKVVARER